MVFCVLKCQRFIQMLAVISLNALPSNMLMCELLIIIDGKEKKQNRFTDSRAHVSTDTCADTYMQHITPPTEWLITNPRPTATDLFIRVCVIAFTEVLELPGFGLTASLNRFIGAPGTAILTYLDRGGRPQSRWAETLGLRRHSLETNASRQMND